MTNTRTKNIDNTFLNIRSGRKPASLPGRSGLKRNISVELQYRYEILFGYLSIIKKKGLFFCCSKAAWRSIYSIFCWFCGIIAWPFSVLFRVKFISPIERGIGHLSIEPDLYIKEGILGMRPSYRTIMLAPRGKYFNGHLVGYWKKYIKIITSPVICSMLDPLQKNNFTKYNTHKFVFSPRKAYYPEIQKRYANRLPLLALSREDVDRGWDILKKFGMRQGEWFASVHCREDGFAGRIEPLRNADIRNYFKAMEAIVKRGGWVVRVGDELMQPLPKMERVIDYVHSGFKSDWMDVFLCGECRFFLGSHSGLYNLACVFGRPSALANWPHLAGILPCGINDIAIPKLPWSEKDRRYWHFREMFDSKLSNSCLSELFDATGLRMLENTPDEISSLAEEMLDKLDGKEIYTEEDERLQEKFKSLMNPTHFSYGAVSRVGRDFLRKYSYLVE